MISFRTELDAIKKVKVNPYEFEAERFLENVIKHLKEMDISKLKEIETLDFGRRNINGEMNIFVAINKKDIIFGKHYSQQDAFQLFAAIKLLLSRSYWVLEDVETFSLKL